MKRINAAVVITALFLSFLTEFSVYASENASLAEETRQTEYGDLLDDCVDFSVVSGHSEGVYADITPEEDRYAFDDFTTFMRKEATNEWIEYKVPENEYLVFHTYFRQNEEISHFSFLWSSDGNVWNEFNPIIEVKPIESWRWYPVIYNLKFLDSQAEFVKVVFNNTEGTVWSPRIAGVYTRVKNPYEDGFFDCIGTRFYEPTAVLKNLGIINETDEGKLEPDKETTRGELAMIVANLLNLSADTAENTPYFKDISPDDYYCGAAELLHNIGVVGGDENECFLPNETVFYSEAVKILTSALGHGEEAEEDGGYPSGYMLMGTRIGLCDGIDLNSGDKMTRGDISILVYNALSIKPLSRITYGGEGLLAVNNMTLLELYHGITKINGILTDVGPLSISGGRVLGSGRAMINDTEVRCDGFDAEKFFGCMVEAYIKHDNTDTIGRLIYVSGGTETTVIDIACTDFDRTQGNILYYSGKDGTERKIRFSDNTRVIYNGRYLTRMGVDDTIRLSCGFIRIISYSDSSAADIVMINEYETFHISSDGYIGSALSDFNKGAVDLKLDDAELVYVNRYGEAAEYSADISVSKDDIINYAASRDGKIAYIYIINSKLTGTAEAVNLKNNTCIIDGKAYDVSDEAIGTVSEYLGKSITAFFDVNNRIAIVRKNLCEGYGYLQSLRKIGGFSDRVELRLFTQDGSIAIYDTTSATKLNGSNAKADVFASLSPQLIRYKLKSDGSLALIETAENISDASNDTFSYNYYSDSCKYYGGGLDVFASKYRVKNDTPIFLVPKDTKDINAYKIRKSDWFITDKSYCIKIYDTSTSFDVGAVVVYLDKSEERTLEYYDPVAIIEDAACILDKEGRKCIDLTVWVNGAEGHIYFDNAGGEDVTGSWLTGHKKISSANGNIEFERGDVMQYYMDDESHCKYFRMLMTKNTLDNKLMYENNLSDYGYINSERYFSELYASFCTVKYKFADKIMVSATDDGVLRTVPLSEVAVYKYDSRRNKLYNAKVADIYPESRIFVRMNFAATREIIVYE